MKWIDVESVKICEGEGDGELASIDLDERFIYDTYAVKAATG